MKVLLVEDEIDLGKLITEILQDAMFVVTYTPDGEEGLYLALNYSYDLIILDLMLPNRDGLSILDEIRDHRISTPVLILTAMGDIEHRVQGLNLGADDYLAKPFDFRELIARCQALVRRKEHLARRTNILRCGDLELNMYDKTVFLGKKGIDLTRKEFQILEFLMLHPGKAVSKRELEEHLWDDEEELWSDVLRSHIKNIRKKLGQGSGTPSIRTVRGVGYVLSP